MKGKTALLVGATGLVGTACLHELIKEKAYTKIHFFTRKKGDYDLPDHVVQHVVDFNELNAFSIDETIDAVFCCLGTTMKKAGSKAAFELVDYTYVMESAKLGLHHNATHFSFVSAVGADENSFFYYNRIKGKVEKDLKQLGYPSLVILRPSMLGGKRSEFRLGEQVGTWIMRLFNPLFAGKMKRYAIVDAEKVAKKMVALSLTHQHGIKLIQSESI